MRLVADAEGEGLGVAILKKLREFRLISAGEKADRPGVVAERPQLPGPVEIPRRYAAIVLQHQIAVVEQEIADVRKTPAVQKIRSALDERVASAELLAKFGEPAGREAVVGDVGAEIVERLDAPIVTAKDDLNAARCIRRGGRDA